MRTGSASRSLGSNADVLRLRPASTHGRRGVTPSMGGHGIVLAPASSSPSRARARVDDAVRRSHLDSSQLAVDRVTAERATMEAASSNAVSEYRSMGEGSRDAALRYTGYDAEQPFPGGDYELPAASAQLDAELYDSPDLLARLSPSGNLQP